MHFTQIIAAAMALPVLSMAAAIPEKRQVDGNCGTFSYLAVGAIAISNVDSRQGAVSVQIRPEGSTKAGDWQEVASLKEGTPMTTINYLGNGPGRKNLRVCNAAGLCIYPAGELKQWSMEQSGDRYAFELVATRQDSNDAFKVRCNSNGRVSVNVPVPTTTAIIAPPLTTVATTTVTVAPTTTSTTKATTTKINTTTTTKKTTTTTTKKTTTTTKSKKSEKTGN